MRKLTLVMSVLITCLCVQVAARSLDDTVTEIPFTFEKGYVIVQAKILTKQVPAELVLATGAEYSTPDDAMMFKHKLSLSFAPDNPKKCDLKNCTFYFTRVSSISLGNLKPVGQTMRLGSMEKIEQRIGRPVFGMLGADFFKGRVVQFDFTRKVVRFLPQSPGDASKDKKTLPATARIVLPMAFYAEYTTLPIAEEITFDGKKIRAVIDTGTAAVVAVSPSATKKLGLALTPDKSSPRSGSVGILRLGDYELTNVPVLFYGKGTGFDRDSAEFGAIVGTGLLQNFVTTFDFRDKVIIFEPI